MSSSTTFKRASSRLQASPAQHHGPAVGVTARRVDKGRAVDLLYARGLVDVAKDMGARLQLTYALEQFLTADQAPIEGAVQDAVWRTMRDEQLRVVGDHGPLRGQGRTARQVEGPVEEPRLPWAAVDLDALNLDGLILQIDAVG